MAKHRKVVIFIVEGRSDEIALASILSELFDKLDVRFLVTHGDITSDKDSEHYNILSKIGLIIKSILDTYKLKNSDIYKVIQIVDMDGAFIDDSQIVFDENQGKPLYETDKIKTNNVEGIKSRNDKKRKNLYRLIRCSKINKDIPYSIYYMSCNLDHVLFDCMNISNEQKESYSIDFALRYSDDIDSFLEFISDKSVFLDGDYNESWDFIQKNTNSLNRFSNLAILVQAMLHSLC